jgi:hypothetical protein
MQDYLLFILNMNQMSNFCCTPTVDLILARLESYEGVKQIESHITTKLICYQDWLQREIEKRLRSEEEVQQRQLAIQKR